MSYPFRDVGDIGESNSGKLLYNLDLRGLCTLAPFTIATSMAKSMVDLVRVSMQICFAERGEYPALKAALAALRSTGYFCTNIACLALRPFTFGIVNYPAF